MAVWQVRVPGVDWEAGSFFLALIWPAYQATLDEVRVALMVQRAAEAGLKTEQNLSEVLSFIPALREDPKKRAEVEAQARLMLRDLSLGASYYDLVPPGVTPHLLHNLVAAIELARQRFHPRGPRVAKLPWPGGYMEPTRHLILPEKQEAALFLLALLSAAFSTTWSCEVAFQIASEASRELALGLEPPPWQALPDQVRERAREALEGWEVVLGEELEKIVEACAENFAYTRQGIEEKRKLEDLFPLSVYPAELVPGKTMLFEQALPREPAKEPTPPPQAQPQFELRQVVPRLSFRREKEESLESAINFYIGFGAKLEERHLKVVGFPITGLDYWASWARLTTEETLKFFPELAPRKAEAEREAFALLLDLAGGGDLAKGKERLSEIGLSLQSFFAHFMPVLALGVWSWARRKLLGR